MQAALSLCAYLETGSGDSKATFEEINRISYSEHIRHDKGNQLDVVSYVNGLSPLQRKIARKLAAGYEPIEIRESLGISKRKYDDEIAKMRTAKGADELAKGRTL